MSSYGFVLSHVYDRPEEKGITLCIDMVIFDIRESKKMRAKGEGREKSNSVTDNDVKY